jgi:amino acid adenylation domain-containing protein
MPGELEPQSALRARCQHPSGRFVPFDPSHVEQSVHARFEQQVDLHADRIAIRTVAETLTYRELDRLANRIAQTILARIGQGAEPVVVLFEHEAVGIAAVLGVLKAGRCYVPLDPAAPVARSVFLVADAGARLIVTHRRCAALAGSLAGDRDILDVDELDASAPSDRPALSVSPDALASIYYTSGSTGRPKGVMEIHRHRLVNARANVNQLRIGADDRLVLLYTVGFSGSVNGIFGALLSGARLCPFDLRAAGPAALARWLREEEITVYHSTPPIFRSLLDALDPADEFPALRVVLLASDSVHASDVARWRARFAPSCLLLNSWGATESPFFRPYFVDGWGELPGAGVPAIGPAAEDADEIRLLDDDGRAVGPDETGQIVLASRHLSPGYWGREDLTRERFRPAGSGDERAYFTGDLGRRLTDGSVVHLGRKDFQVKVRGYRVEPGEVEAELRALPGIASVVVTGQADGQDGQRLVAYVVPSGTAPAVSALRRALGDRLPEYLVPTRFVFMSALPLTANGKLDRLALPDPGRARPALDRAFREPSTPLERALAELWAAVLDLDEVGVDDDFLELGGDSLRAMQIATRVQEIAGVSVPVQALFEAPTVALMASAIARHQPAR